MTRAPLRSIVTLIGVSLAACTGTRPGPAAGAPPSTLGQMGDAAAMARARADSARKPYTAADIRFMSSMISHHAQAIKMARWVPSHEAGAAIQRLSERIINAQTDEIRLMQTWLRDRSQPVPDANPAGMTMTMGGAEHVMLMPGMLTEEQMKQLDAARALEFDRLFLTFMIQHHRGAVDMVKTLFSSYGAGQDDTVFKFASDVNVDQSTEIARMLQMLLELGSTAPTP